ncbi:Transcriptional regulatory protein tcrA [Dermatophilus congolensis]|uniref:Transcriptional regulatory protein tcrA n=1 Tax=Dermatophilus congolensis TaxID=1863 RepID=A0AA46H154_9MICO|nr:Transcriptional regulatory protein tcrA [Dermatophilus congolensis]
MRIATESAAAGVVVPICVLARARCPRPRHGVKEDGVRVLVVEDDLAMAGLISTALTDQGFAVDMEHEGHAGLAAASGTGYDVVILDIMLPGLSGYRIVEKLRERGNWTPVLMLTAKDGPYDEADAFDLGADDYLTKPFDVVVLLARLRALVRRGAPARPATLMLGDLSLDPSTHRVYRGDKEVRLTAKEFAVLEFFMRHPGQLLTKKQILGGVWDAEFTGDVNIVEVYVGYLRKKLDTAFGRASFETIRGAGYRLVNDLV